jgi:hypothetical protein
VTWLRQGPREDDGYEEDEGVGVLEFLTKSCVLPLR